MRLVEDHCIAALNVAGSRASKAPEIYQWVMSVLEDAFFWSESQAQFLRDDILDDADWAEVVDQLDVLLRKGRGV